MKIILGYIFLILSGCSPIIATYWDYSWRNSFQNGNPIYKIKKYRYFKKNTIYSSDVYGVYAYFFSSMTFREPLNFVLTNDGYLIGFNDIPESKKLNSGQRWGTYKIEIKNGIKYFAAQYFKPDGVSGPTIYNNTVSRMSGYFEGDSLLFITVLFSNRVIYDTTYSVQLNPPLRYQCVPDSILVPKDNWLIDNNL
ncbi:MAG: hypothetical protein L6Q77_13275 [Bacteroidetes bacterium]|nr:hypothetical protein [Bacteroidota bacterium]